jgi:hypothetical protein
MSRRKAFDTGLTGGSGNKGKAPQKAPSVTSSADTERTIVTASKKGKAVVASTSGTVTPPVVATGEEALCFICAEPVTYWAVGQCNHHVCQ